ncbi:MAG: TlpA family protein disulfide reductase [Victivallales bacterium]|jgi:thiol-disulfide isomerase/thioredoxin|nr:TlpA family protein disulfide reductase [Victivallales bacterium]MBT7300893.1 TlpA family protein disulfide reductase [Victivallales bacterium]
MRLFPSSLALVLACVVTTGAADGFKRERIPARDRLQQDTLEGKPPPALQVKAWLNVEGKGPKLSAFKGKVVVIRVWATWCGGCRRSAPEMKKVYEKYRGKGLVVVGIHTTKGGENAAAFLREKGITWPVGIDDANKTIEALGCVAGKPDYTLIDRKGILRFADLADAELERAVKLLLAEDAE